MKSVLLVQAASLSALPFWYPFYAIALKQKYRLTTSNPFAHKREYFRGLRLTLCLQPLYPLLFKLNETINECLGLDKHATLSQSISSLSSGVVSVLVANPYEVILIDMQKNKVNARMAASRIYYKRGILGFYRGYLFMMLRNSVFCWGLLGIYPQIKEYIDNTRFQVISPLIAGIVPAIMRTSIMPLDLGAVLKQADQTIKPKSYFQGLKMAYRKHGIFGYFISTKYTFLMTFTEMLLFHQFLKLYSRE